MADLKQLQEFKTVRILVPVTGAPPLPLECVARSENPPFIDVHFLPDQLPTGRLNTEGICQISFELGDRAHAFSARIDKVVSPEQLRLEAVQVFQREQQREYFRIDVELSLRYRRLSEGENSTPRRIQAKVNLSGGGLWFPLTEVLQPLERLSVEILLPGAPPARIFAVVEVIRMTGSDEASRGVALKFAEIGEDHRDQIVAFCFAEQRRQLRSRVKLTDHR